MITSLNAVDYDSTISELSFPLIVQWYTFNVYTEIHFQEVWKLMITFQL